MTYKKHEISTIWVAEQGWFYIIDGDKTKGYCSGKDAKAVISGGKARWGFKDISNC